MPSPSIYELQPGVVRLTWISVDGTHTLDFGPCPAHGWSAHESALQWARNRLGWKG